MIISGVLMVLLIFTKIYIILIRWKLCIYDLVVKNDIGGLIGGSSALKITHHTPRGYNYLSAKKLLRKQAIKSLCC